ncbi:MAG TPA: hypothetical protein VE547_19575, partial [Mycobacteriales bacterium]|nr:hypothetical protein [Mycobacteriales bacterium]
MPTGVVVALDDSIEFRLLALAAAGPGAPPGWLTDFLAPERIPADDYLARLAALAPGWRLELHPDGPPAAGSPVDAVITERRGLSDAELAGLPGLRGVVVYGRWVPPADEARYAQRGLAVRAVRRATTDSVADHTLALLLAHTRRLLDGALLGIGVERAAAGVTPGDRSGHAPTVFNWRGVAG